MSANATNILTAIYSLLASVLTGYQEIPHVYDPAKNNSRQARLGYGARVGSGEPGATVTTHYTMDRQFEIVLTDTVPKMGDSDEQLRDAIGVMDDKADELFRRMVQTKLGVSEVLLVSEPRLLAPEVVDGDGKIVILVMQVTIKYRNTLTA